MRSLGIKFFLLVLALALLSAPLACGAGKGSDSDVSHGAGATGAGAASGGSGMGGDIFGTGGNGPTSGLEVVPPTATIEVQNGMSSPVDFEAMLDGNPVNATWVVDLSAIANVDGAGLVTATNTLGGKVKVRAAFNGKTAEAVVTVNLKTLQNPAGTVGTDQVLLKSAVDPDPTIQWTYPYDKTVFPKGLLAPELMWNNGGDNDTYYVHYVGTYVDLEVFTKAAPPSRFALDDPTWKALSESGPGGKVKLTVARLPPGAASATVVVNHEWTIANGSLKGTVYYWANSLGRVLRIKPGAVAPDDFLAAAGYTTSCSTCHAVSADGSTLIIGGDLQNVTTFDLLNNTGVFALGSTPRPWAMPAISPNGKVLIENNAPLPGPPGGSDAMFDAVTGQKLAGTGLDGVYLDMPAFAPNGTKLAYVDHTTHGLGIYDFDVATTTASNPLSLVPMGADASLNAIAFPSVSPDAKWIVYHRGQWPNSLDTRTGPGNLYLASVDQPGVEVRLGETDGDTYPFAAGDRDRNYNYEPTFAPLDSGGYAWVVFTSRRTYGNRLTGGKDVVKQLWVTAIDQSPQAGQDPSHPAFWVPGQDLNTLNMRGYWALDPCKPNGQVCSTGSECCNQNCDEGICKDPDPNECADTGNACSDAVKCCDPLAVCINGFCSEPPPP